MFLVTFVTTDKSNPSGAKNKNLLHRLPTKEQRTNKIYAVILDRFTGASSDAPTDFDFMLFLCGQTVQVVFVRPLRWGYFCRL